MNRDGKNWRAAQTKAAALHQTHPQGDVRLSAERQMQDSGSQWFTGEVNGTGWLVRVRARRGMFVLGVPYRLCASHVAGVSAMVCVSLPMRRGQRRQDVKGPMSQVKPLAGVQRQVDLACRTRPFVLAKPLVEAGRRACWQGTRVDGESIHVRSQLDPSDENNTMNSLYKCKSPNESCPTARGITGSPTRNALRNKGTTSGHPNE